MLIIIFVFNDNYLKLEEEIENIDEFEIDE